MRFNEFVANDRLIEEITEAVKTNTLPHAIILDGAKGTGKQTLAKIIARSFVCTSEGTSDIKPCGKCPACLKAEHLSHPDIFIANGNNTGELTVDAIRNIRADAYIKPNEAPTKVYLLLNCDKMLAPAQNSFLKVLEEPPANVVFIMTVTSANMLLQTVRSRSRLYTLYPVQPQAAAEYIYRIFPEKDYGDILHTAQLCDGNIGKTLEMLESGGEEAKKIADEIFTAAIKGNEYTVLTSTNKITASRTLAVSVLDFLTENVAECVRASVGIKTLSAVAEDTAKRMTKGRILRLAENIERAKQVLETNVNLNFFSTWLSSMLKV